MCDKIGRVAVIGMGTMGSDISLLFALYDFEVVVNDISRSVLDNLERKHRQTLDELHKLGLTQKKYETVKEKITVARKLEDIKDVDFVLEAVNEDLTVKRNLFAHLDKLPLEVVLATNTSFLRVSDIAKGLKGAKRIGLMHFSNPPILSPLVEVVKGEETSEETLKTIAEVAKRIGKTPVILRKDMNGAVLNRILGGLGSDAFLAIQRGEVTPEELDASMKAAGFPVGFAEVADMIGLDIILSVNKTLSNVYGASPNPTLKFLEDMVKEGRLGKKSGRGFYDWTKGHPIIDTKLAGKYDVMRIIANGVNAAFGVIKDEVADPKTIDTVMKLGSSSQMGICEIADLIGLDKLLEVLKRLYKEYGLEIYKPCPMFEEYVKRGWTGRVAGRGLYEYQ
ncbi:MAG: 3-hydroxyacyl-CoA dehydrogenase [Candidatus Jordarchaeaceae archaeon]